MSISWHLDVDPSPAILVLPRDAASLDEAHAAIELWEHYKRRTLDGPQRLAVEVMMATRSDDLWAAPTTGREVSRQNGKGDEIEVVEFWGLVQRSERILHTVHDAVLLATETQNRMLSLLEGHPDLRRLLGRVWRGTGQQMIEMRNGGTVWYRTRTNGGARGVDEVDRIVVDEAQHAEDEHLAAITPTQLASANPQLNALGTAAIAGRSKWWWRQRKRALRTDPGAFGYVGHSAEVVLLGADGKLTRSTVDPLDRANWRKANPVIASGRKGEDFFEEQLERLGPELFAREHLGVWDPEPDDDGVKRPVSLESWGACMDLGACMPDGRVVLGVHVAPEGRTSSITAIGALPDGRAFVEVQVCRAGTEWLEDELRRMLSSTVRKVAAVGCLGRGPVVEVLPSLVRATDAHRVPLERLNGPEYAAGCQAFVTAVEARQLVHTGQTWLSTGIGGATKHAETGDVWTWDFGSTIDGTPVVSATVAYRLLDRLPVKKRTRVGAF